MGRYAYVLQLADAVPRKRRPRPFCMKYSNQAGGEAFELRSLLDALGDAFIGS